MSIFDPELSAALLKAASATIAATEPIPAPKAKRPTQVELRRKRAADFNQQSQIYTADYLMHHPITKAVTEFRTCLIDYKDQHWLQHGDDFSQIYRSVSSVGANFLEAYGRKSAHGQLTFMQYASGSCFEVLFWATALDTKFLVDMAASLNLLVVRELEMARANYLEISDISGYQLPDSPVGA